jgi:hypothetical protein
MVQLAAVEDFTPMSHLDLIVMVMAVLATKALSTSVSPLSKHLKGGKQYDLCS